MSKRGGKYPNAPWWLTTSRLSSGPPFDVECPQCGVPPGKACIDKKGRLAHAARREASYKGHAAS